MARRMTEEVFFKRAFEKHGEQYDYSKTEFIDTRHYIYFRCNLCSKEIKQYANEHLKGKKPKCDCKKFLLSEEEIKRRVSELKYGNNYTILFDERKTGIVPLICNKHNLKFNFYLDRKKCCCVFCKRQEQFISNLEKKYNFGYDYSETVYKNKNTEIKVACKKHGIFKVIPENLMKGCGCKECLKEKREKIWKYKREKIFETKIEKIKRKYENKFYIENSDNFHNIKFKCAKCGNTENVPIDRVIFKNKKCSFCEYTGKITKEIFLERAKNIFGENRYEYDLSNFKNAHSTITVKCLKHNYTFSQKVYSHLAGHGCSLCCETSGERKIRIFLEDNNMEYIPYFWFDDLKDESKLSYDFYLPKYNLLIEFNGIQHYGFVPYFHKTLHDFHKQLHHDWLKRKYAYLKGIKLVCIPYWEYENIENILKEEK